VKLNVSSSHCDAAFWSNTVKFYRGETLLAELNHESGFDNFEIENSCDMPDELFVMLLGMTYYAEDIATPPPIVESSSSSD
jgi:hypothetical protein